MTGTDRRLPTYPEVRRRHANELDDLISTALARTGGNQSSAARLIDIDRGAMLRRMQRRGIRFETSSKPEEQT